MPIHNIYKPLGWTPLQALEALRSQHPELKDSPMTYAGRLDPMAEGVLLILSGEDRHNLHDHLKHDKIYEAEVMFGVSTDTHDALGLPGEIRPTCTAPEAQNAIRSLIGDHTLPFPVFSAYKVNGKPLHWWAQMDRLNEIEIPFKEMRVKEISGISVDHIGAEQLLQDIQARIANVTGVFRQERILPAWEQVLKSNTPPLTRGRFLCTVTSGTYIRSLAHLMGEQLGCGAFLCTLKRHAVGDYRLEDSEVIN